MKVSIRWGTLLMLGQMAGPLLLWQTFGHPVDLEVRRPIGMVSHDRPYPLGGEELLAGLHHEASATSSMFK